MSRHPPRQPCLSHPGSRPPRTRPGHTSAPAPPPGPDRRPRPRPQAQRPQCQRSPQPRPQPRSGPKPGVLPDTSPRPRRLRPKLAPACQRDRGRTFLDQLIDEGIQDPLTSLAHPPSYLTRPGHDPGARPGRAALHGARLRTTTHRAPSHDQGWRSKPAASAGTWLGHFQIRARRSAVGGAGRCRTILPAVGTRCPRVAMRRMQPGSSDPRRTARLCGGKLGPAGSADPPGRPGRSGSRGSRLKRCG